MEKIRRTLLALLLSFSFLGLVACDDGTVDDGVGNGVEMEEPVAP